MCLQRCYMSNKIHGVTREDSYGENLISHAVANKKILAVWDVTLYSWGSGSRCLQCLQLQRQAVQEYCLDLKMEELSSFDTARTTHPPNYTVSCSTRSEILAAPLRETRISHSKQYLPSNLIWFVILN
jgi:hypothetical protein